MKEFRTLIEKYPVKKFKRGEIILCENEVPTSAYIIKKGVVKTYNLTAEGQEKPISFDIKNEMFPVGWIFGKLKAARFFYEAFTDCEVFVVPRDEYIKTLYDSKNHQALVDAFDFFITNYLDFQLHVYSLEQSRATSKVVHTIHTLALRFGQDIRKDVVRVGLALTQQDLANFMGLTRETTGIELKKLEKAGIIKVQRRNFIVYTDKLNDILDEEYAMGRVMEPTQKNNSL